MAGRAPQRQPRNFSGRKQSLQGRRFSAHVQRRQLSGRSEGEGALSRALDEPRAAAACVPRYMAFPIGHYDAEKSLSLARACEMINPLFTSP